MGTFGGLADRLGLSCERSLVGTHIEALEDDAVRGDFVAGSELDEVADEDGAGENPAEGSTRQRERNRGVSARDSHCERALAPQSRLDGQASLKQFHAHGSI